MTTISKTESDFALNNLLDEHDEYIFHEAVALAGRYNMEFVEHQTLDYESDEFDSMDLILFKSNTNTLDDVTFKKRVYELSDPEFAYFDAYIVGDLVIISARI